MESMLFGFSHVQSAACAKNAAGEIGAVGMYTSSDGFTSLILGKDGPATAWKCSSTLPVLLASAALQFNFTPPSLLAPEMWTSKM